MNISELFIRKPIMTTLMTVMIVVTGIVCYFQLPISSLPNVDYPVIQISAYYPGATPSTMASAVATPLEAECMQINGITSIISDNGPGYTTITITFNLSRNVDLLAPDVQAAISRAQNNLPSDLPTPPTYSKTNPSDAPVMYVIVSSETLTAGNLYDYAKRLIGNRINTLDGISKVEIFAAKAAVRIQVDPRKLASVNLGLNDVAQALKSGTVSIPGGSLNGESHTFSIEPQGQLRSAAEYGNLILACQDGNPVRIMDVATCVDSVNNDIVDVRFGAPGRPIEHGAICMAISRQAGANTVAVCRNVLNTIDKLRHEIPQSVKIELLHDASEPIKDSIKDVEETIIIAIVLVIIIIFIFLGRIRETIIPAITIPISILATFVLMAAFKFSLDTLSLMAIVLSIGFLVDDAIVELENTVRHIDAGMKPIPASIKSVEEISITVISTSLALITVFVPLVFMGGIVGRNFREFALTVIFAIAASLFLARTLTPMMCARILKPQGENRNSLQKFIDRYVGAMIHRYGIMLTWTLHHKWLAGLIWIACIAGTLWLFVVLPKGFLPAGDSSMIQGVMMKPLGSSSGQMKTFQTKVMDRILQDPSVDRMISISGHQAGPDQSTGFLYIHLKPTNKRPPIDEVIAGLYPKLYMPEGFTFMMPMPVLKLSAGGDATASGSKYSYTLSGNDREKLYNAADLLEAALKARPRVFNSVQTSIKVTLPQLNINILRDRASTLGIAASDIEIALLLAFAQGRTTTFTTDNDQYDVVIELDKNYQVTPGDLSLLYLRSSRSNELVPLDSLVEIEQTLGPASVPHSHQMDAATISFNIEDNIPLGDAVKELNVIAGKVVPRDITGSLQGEAQEFENSMKSLGVLMVAAVFLMYIILGILYESYVHPFTVLSTLPVAAFGGLLTLLIFRAELSLYAYIGVFMLLGVIAKNGIMMVDFAEQEMHKGKSTFDAIHSACVIRFRPILMTGLAAIAGAIPIAVGYGADGSSRIPLGLVIVGGLAFAQVITLFVTPGIFLYMDIIQRKFRSSSEHDDDEPAPKPA